MAAVRSWACLPCMMSSVEVACHEAAIRDRPLQQSIQRIPFVVLAIEVDYYYIVDCKPQDVAALVWSILICRELRVSADVRHDSRSSGVAVPGFDWRVGVVCRMGLREAAGVCRCRPWFLEEHDVVSFRVCQCKGTVVDRGNLADVGLKDPEGLFLASSCSRAPTRAHDRGDA